MWCLTLFEPRVKQKITTEKISARPSAPALQENHAERYALNPMPNSCGMIASGG
jgi:hypothetical protein